MSDQDMKTIKDWVISNGVASPQNPGLDLTNVVDMNGKELRTMPLDDLSDLVVQLSSYCLYLKSIKGTLIAQITYHENILNTAVQKKSRTLDKFMNKEEKMSVALDSDPKLREMERQLILLQMKYHKIKEIPYSIDRQIEIIKMIFSRRISVEKGLA